MYGCAAYDASNLSWFSKATGLFMIKSSKIQM